MLRSSRSSRLRLPDPILREMLIVWSASAANEYEQDEIQCGDTGVEGTQKALFHVSAAREIHRRGKVRRQTRPRQSRFPATLPAPELKVQGSAEQSDLGSTRTR